MLTVRYSRMLTAVPLPALAGRWPAAGECASCAAASADGRCAAQVKQRGTPDPGVRYGPLRRSACTLDDGSSTAFFWDDNTAPKCVVARLRSQGSGGWEWSGGFELQEREDYLGLRMHHVDAQGVRDGHTVIMPVSIAVDASGVVLITFKSRQNLPPYRIRNSCAAVDIIISQHTKSVRSAAGSPPRRVGSSSVQDAVDGCEDSRTGRSMHEAQLKVVNLLRALVLG